MHIVTPLIHSTKLSEIAGFNVHLKMEALQPVGSFKNRGIGNLCSDYAEKGAKCFVCSSGGNAGVAVAYAGRKLGVLSKIITPKSTPKAAIQMMEREGAEVTIYGDEWRQADQLARELAAQKDHYYISPFDHPLIWEGYSSIAREVHNQGIIPDAVVMSVGGGGLFCGIVEGKRQLNWNEVLLVTAETEGAASFARSMESGERIILDKIDTIAVTLGANQVAEEAFKRGVEENVEPHIVSDEQAISAVDNFLKDHRIKVESSCGAALAVIYERLLSLPKQANIVVIVCGGVGVNF